jgi:hypothetical protein
MCSGCVGACEFTPLLRSRRTASDGSVGKELKLVKRREIRCKIGFCDKEENGNYGVPGY